MECLCPIVLLFMLLTVGYHQLFGSFFNKIYGLEEWDAEEYADENDDEFTDEELNWEEDEWEDLSSDEDDEDEEQEERREPVDVRALLDSSLPPEQYTVFHNVAFTSELDHQGMKTLQVDHVVVAETGLFCIRVLRLDGEINPADDKELDWDHWVSDEVVESFPNPLGEICSTASRLARALDLQSWQAVGIVASAGKGTLYGDDVPSCVYYASDLPATFERRWKERLTADRIADVTSRLRAGLR